MNRGERNYSWAFLRDMEPQKAIFVTQDKDCRKAPNAALQAARRFGMKIKTKCKQCPDGTSILTIIRPPDIIRIP